MSDPSHTIPVTLKWNKHVYELTIELGEPSVDFKQRVEELTGVPVNRQKLLAKKGGWKGPLKDDIILDISKIKDIKQLNVTLIGSAETLAAPTQQTTFIEDLSPEDLRAAEEAEAQAAMATAQGMIPALQLPPHRRDDHKQGFYQYNRLVSGLPQKQIEQELQHGQGDSNRELQGKVAMSLGMELRRAYVNDLAVLRDGSCVSAMDDGHVQLWKHGAQQHDVIHAPGADGGADNIVALREKQSLPVAFATSGKGILQLWTAEADPIIAVQSSMPGTTPSSLATVYGGTQLARSTSDDNTFICLAARFRITRQANPFQFHLQPQNDVERQRRAEAEARERAIQEALGKASRSVQVWLSVDSAQLLSRSTPKLQSKILEPPNGFEESAPVSSLTSVSLTDGSRLLVAGDIQGGMRVWKARPTGNADIQFEHLGYYQLRSETDDSCSIVTMSVLSNSRVAVSTEVGSYNRGHSVAGAVVLPVRAPRAVHILDLSQLLASTNTIPVLHSTLMGHNDAVICLCQLPNGDLLTGGGKFDATLQLWSKPQLEAQSDGSASQYTASRKSLTDVGYVLALATLPDAKEDSNYYAVAAARYNSVRLVI